MKFRVICLVLCVYVVGHVESRHELWEREMSTIVNVTRRRVTNDVTRYWSDHVVPYVIANIYSRKEQDLIRAAMQDWQDNTCLTFRPATTSDTSVISYEYSQGCASALGKQSQKQKLYLHKPGCMSKSTIMHEIGHALGLVHEHQHPHRDKGIKIVKDKIKLNGVIWFDKYEENALDFFGVDYDMDSVMHYDSTAFNKDGKSKTMLTIDPSLQRRLDNYYKYLSFSDVLIVNRMLKCDHRAKCSRVRCSTDGYIDVNCKCHTPKDYFDRRCTNPGGEEYCKDQFLSNKCDHNPDVIGKCMKMCDYCPMYKVPRTKWRGGCEDKYYDTKQCQKWKAEGLCEKRQYKRVLATHCAKSCNLCGVNPECLDDDENCKAYDKADCKRGRHAYQYMMDHCRNWCGGCKTTG